MPLQLDLPLLLLLQLRQQRPLPLPGLKLLQKNVPPQRPLLQQKLQTGKLPL
jgi:hypothetical protein